MHRGISNAATQNYARKIPLVKKLVPLILLVVLVMISVAALSGLARNVAQKLTLFSDPLCRMIWKKQKSYQIAQNLTEVKRLELLNISFAEGPLYRAALPMSTPEREDMQECIKGDKAGEFVSIGRRN
ncbi:MAG: hypothetical protein L0H12_06740, partial [Nitrosospira sp.]|nr:hypothetical protein [Nitrosospira sp.]